MQQLAGAGPEAGHQVHVGRRPVYDAALEVVAYEVLARCVPDSTRPGGASDSVEAAVLAATLAEFGLAELAGGRVAYVRSSREVLVGNLPVPVPAALPGAEEATVLMVPGSVEADRELLAGIARLRFSGYRIGLDDAGRRPDLEALRGLVDLVRVDVPGTGPDVRTDVLRRCAGHGVTLLAAGVEDSAAMRALRGEGFTLFQGQNLARLRPSSTSSLSPSQVTAMRLLAELGREDADVRRVEELVRIDPALTYRLLRIVNSAGTGLSRRLTTLREALMLVGLQRLHGWLLLLTLTDIAPADDRLELSVARAKACELLAAGVPGAAAESAFMVGLVEGLRSMLALSASEVCSQLGLDPSVAEALEGPRTPLGVVLFAVLAHERDDLTGVQAAGVGLLEVSRAYLQAVRWSRSACQATA